MAKQENKTHVAHNKEFNQNNKGAKKKDKGVTVNVSQEERESAEIAVALVQDAFARYGKKTKVFNVRRNYFNPKTQRYELNVRKFHVCPINDQGYVTGPGPHGTELEWAALHINLKVERNISERDEAVKALAEDERLRKFLEA